MYLSQPRDIITLSPGCSRRPASLHSYSAERERLSSSTSWVSDRSSIPSPASDSSAACFSFSPHQARAQEMQPITRSTIGVHGEPHALSLDRLKFDATAVPEPSRPRSRWMRSQHFQNVWDSLDPGTVDTRPPHPYTELIKLCILKRREGKLTLNQLYRDLEDKFAFFASSAKGKGWKNTLRHNLSTQPYFIKLDREHGQLGKGHYWAYCPDLEKPTSLAQSSVVQLSSLWPPSATSASASLSDVATRGLSSAGEWPMAPPLSPPRLRPWTSVERTRWETHDGSRVRLERPQYLDATMDARAIDGAARRFSGPVLAPRVARADPVGLMRMRSATIATVPEPRRVWPPPSSASSPESARECLPSLPALPQLPPTPPRTSLGDYYLAHPIARSRS
ncbi:uncharacterized protein PAN0_003d1559 [Moesziomyces antarcticus]|uniref:Fork-head domain-containing protein n=1 Tax=Pseudozyma antarctica TaxID=84753 RepID=A0A5C3FJX2_PSEA2|nr:uncharacterized protein PAN0_003d1559 [Moesziomyces antarcticus]GAK63355.1 conserved hypothetical protein [Moesziomyces antarcticus]SPO43937.1 uncharacterized protein PSANT_01622 [Moesziomyces antarcticus]